jgi:hypothetical protein
MFFSCKRICGGSDPATDTVRINLPLDATDPAQTGQESPGAEREFAQAAAAAEREREEERRREEQEEEDRRRAEEDERRRAEEEEEELRRAEEEELRRLARLEEEEARLRAERELAEQGRREQEEALRQERRAQVRAFLKAEGFADVGSSRRKMLRKSYPLHRAAELGDGRMVEHLLAEGADPSQKNSAGLTASQVATKKNKEGSHSGALRALGGA